MLCASRLCFCVGVPSFPARKDDSCALLARSAKAKVAAIYHHCLLAFVASCTCALQESSGVSKVH
jgi:hypothetical protein